MSNLLELKLCICNKFHQAMSKCMINLKKNHVKNCLFASLFVFLFVTPNLTTHINFFVSDPQAINKSNGNAISSVYGLCKYTSCFYNILDLLFENAILNVFKLVNLTCVHF